MNKASVAVLFAVFWAVLFANQALAQEPPPAVTAPRQGIVVWRLEQKSGVSEADIDSISGYVTVEVEKHSGLKAVSDADIKTILGGEEKKQRCGVDGTSCIAEIGSALGVPEAVSGDLGRMGDYWMLNLRRINVRKAEVMARVGRQTKGDVNALIEMIPQAVAELFGKEVAKAQERAVQVTVPSKRLNAYQVAAYSSFFPGLALVVLGGVGQWQMHAAKNDYYNHDTGAKDRHALWKGVSAAGYAVGGAAMATGIALWIADALRAKPGKAASSAPEAAGGVSPVPGGAALQIRLAW